jgi:hypothetical protein
MLSTRSTPPATRLTRLVGAGVRALRGFCGGWRHGAPRPCGHGPAGVAACRAPGGRPAGLDALPLSPASPAAPQVACYSEILRVLKPGGLFAGYEWVLGLGGRGGGLRGGRGTGRACQPLCSKRRPLPTPPNPQVVRDGAVQPAGQGGRRGARARGGGGRRRGVGRRTQGRGAWGEGRGGRGVGGGAPGSSTAAAAPRRLPLMPPDTLLNTLPKSPHPTRKIIAEIELGNGLPDTRTISETLASLRAAGFEVLESRDLALDADVPWWEPIDPDSWRLASEARRGARGAGRGARGALQGEAEGALHDCCAPPALSRSSGRAEAPLHSPRPITQPPDPSILPAADFRTTKLGRLATHALVRGLEAVGVAPKGSLQVRGRARLHGGGPPVPRRPVPRRRPLNAPSTTPRPFPVPPPAPRWRRCWSAPPTASWRAARRASTRPSCSSWRASRRRRATRAGAPPARRRHLVLCSGAADRAAHAPLCVPVCVCLCLSVHRVPAARARPIRAARRFWGGAATQKGGWGKLRRNQSQRHCLYDRAVWRGAAAQRSARSAPGPRGATPAPAPGRGPRPAGRERSHLQSLHAEGVAKRAGARGWGPGRAPGWGLRGPAALPRACRLRRAARAIRRPSPRPARPNGLLFAPP